MSTDLNDPLDDIFNAAGQPATVVKPTPPASYQAPTYVESCPKCINGFWRGNPRYPCFNCQGKGKVSYKTSPEARASKRTSAANIKAAKIEAWIKANPEVHAWIRRNVDKAQPFEFAQAMEAALIQYGSLTDGQQAACERLVAKDKARQAERAAHREAAPAVTVDALEAAFEKARNYKRLPNQLGVKRLQLRLDTFVFKPAARHPGTIYVTDKTERDSEGQPLYLGKIEGGKFYSQAVCGAERAARIVAAAADPAKAAKAYGQRFGQCCVCGRELTAEESIKGAIGPICATKYGF